MIIDHPDLLHGRDNADFGKGFYLTPDREFADKWALSEAYRNEYELDTEGLEVLRLERNEDWFDYIYGNRHRKDTATADVVMGPIANDTIYNTFGFISSGFLSPEEALKLLRIGPEYTQVVIKTEKALNQLKYLGSPALCNTAAMREQVKGEEEEYLEKFSKAMEELAE